MKQVLLSPHCKEEKGGLGSKPCPRSRPQQRAQQALCPNHPLPPVLSEESAATY